MQRMIVMLPLQQPQMLCLMSMCFNNNICAAVAVRMMCHLCLLYVKIENVSSAAE